MADERADAETPEDDPVVEFPEDIFYVERAPIAAVSVRQGGSASGSSLHVVCSDGACFKLTRAGEWLELEPVPGTERAAGSADDPDV